MDDAELVVAARGGDRAAFAAIFDRYADRVYDFAAALLRDKDEAAEATVDTFLMAAQRIAQLREPDRLEAWLFGVSRHEALRRGRAQSLPKQVPIPLAGDSRTDSAGVAWLAAAGLPERDRVLLDLNLRQGLEGIDLADGAGVEQSQVQPLLDKAKDDAERELGAVLVASQHRDECPELDKLLEGSDGTLTPDLRKRLTRHVDRCEKCGLNRRNLPSALVLLTTVPSQNAPTVLRDRVWYQAQLATAGGLFGWRIDGFPPGGFVETTTEGPGRRGVLAAVAALVALALLVGIAAFALTRDNGDGNVALTPGTSTTTTPTTVVGVTPRTVSTLVTGTTATTLGNGSTVPTTSVTLAPIPTSTTTTAPSTSGSLSMPPSVAIADNSSTQVIPIKNAAATPLTFKVTQSSKGLAVTPSSGTVAGGATMNVTVNLDRNAPGEGTFTGQVIVESTGGTGSTKVMAVINTPPVIKLTLLNTLPGSTCSTGKRDGTDTIHGDEQFTISARLSDTNPGVTSATAFIKVDGNAEFAVPMSLPSSGSGDKNNGVWTTAAQGQVSGGVLHYRVSATDGRGAKSDGPTQSATITANCG